MNEGAGADAKAQYKGWPISKDEWDEIFGFGRTPASAPRPS
jgi:hypothetical protein